jgi:hypothetical protein
MLEMELRKTGCEVMDYICRLKILIVSNIYKCDDEVSSMKA